MYLPDCHNHTLCSPDSQAPLSAMAQAAAKAGLSLLCTTDHCDLLDVRGRETPDWDWTPVLEQFSAVRAECPRGLDLRLGVELGSAQFRPDRAREILAAAPLDLVIGSAHNLSPARGGVDFYYLPYETEAACYAALEDYFESLLAIARLDLCDVIGHIIYPLRYMNGRAGRRVTLEPCRDRLEALLKAAVASGKGIEVNTNRGRDVEPWRPLLSLYRALGGELVTLGSDAHAPEDVGGGIARAVELLKETGFRYLTVYSRRRPELIAI